VRWQGRIVRGQVVLRKGIGHKRLRCARIRVTHARGDNVLQVARRLSTGPLEGAIQKPQR